MPKGSIYVTANGEKDLSRWITISPISESLCQVKLQDLVHPGMPSGLKQFECPTSLLEDVQKEGFFQLTIEQGFCQMRARQGLVEISFRGNPNEKVVTCEIPRQEFDNLIASLRSVARAS